jgi:SAM-dependent methyltransferase
MSVQVVDQSESRLQRFLRSPFKVLFNKLRYESRMAHCWACGRFGQVHVFPVYTPEMSVGHGFTPEMTRYYDLREGRRCRNCGCSLRAQHIAKTLVKLYGEGRCRSFVQLCRQEKFRSMAIAEINGCSFLRQYMDEVPGVRYSEYGSTDPAVPSEDILNLSYPDKSFDLVLTSDSLEHIPDVDRALAEVRRVLRVGGRHVFTIPVLWDREKTVVRAYVNERGETVHLLPPCYHGGSLNVEDCLAFYEYGRDVADRVRAAGFDVVVESSPKNPAVSTFVSRRLD